MRFTLTGTLLGTLNEQSFADLTSFDRAGGPTEGDQSLIARFQRVGIDGSGSDAAIPNPVTAAR